MSAQSTMAIVTCWLAAQMELSTSELSTFDSGCQFSQLDLNCSEASGSASEASEASASTSDASDASDASEDAAMPLIFGRVSICCERDASQADAAMPLIFGRVSRTTYRTVADSTVICCERDASQAEAAI